eukprot:429241_1
MDSLHFYLFHCYDVGIRTRKQEQETEEKTNDQYFDAAFSRIHKLITQRAHVTKAFSRFSTNKNSKFNIKSEQEEQMDNDNGDNTYLDAVYQYLQSKNSRKSDIKKLNEFIKDEEYETDSIGYDIDIKDGNIAKDVDNDCIKTFKILCKQQRPLQHPLALVYGSIIGIIIKNVNNLIWMNK